MPNLFRFEVERFHINLCFMSNNVINYVDKGHKNAQHFLGIQLYSSEVGNKPFTFILVLVPV